MRMFKRNQIAAMTKLSGSLTGASPFVDLVLSTSPGNRVVLANLAGNPSKAANFRLTINPGVIVSQPGDENPTLAAITYGDLPAGSTVTIINRGLICGRGGNGGGGGQASRLPGRGGDAISISLPTVIDNSEGYIFGGGGGGGGGYPLNPFNGNYGGGGGGGAGGFMGQVGGYGVGFSINGTLYAGQDGTVGISGKGGAGGPAYNAGNQALPGAAGGDYGQFGGTTTVQSGGAPGKAIVRNGQSLTFLAGNDSTRVKGSVV